jgi:hypothetical protein
MRPTSRPGSVWIATPQFGAVVTQPLTGRSLPFVACLALPRDDHAIKIELHGAPVLGGQ